MSGKKIAITLGDPAGISPEILVKSIDKLPPATYVIYGSKGIIDKYIKELKQENFYKLINSPNEATSQGFYLVNIEDQPYTPGKPSRQSGKASVEYLKRAVSDILNKKVDALTTLPISKENIMDVGFKHAGHTDFLAEAAKVKDYVMVLMCEKLKVALITTHIPLREVPQSISQEKIEKIVKLIDKELREKFNIPHPKIAVLGLNPHAGDGGYIGDEEIKIINPAVEKLKKEGINVVGALSADTAFNRYKEFDMFVAMYHDQGLIPLKLLCFKKAVNITLGLPFIRTSPDHGTGFDIAGKLIADPSSFIEAVKLAKKLANRS